MVERLTAKIRPQILAIIFVVGFLAYVALKSDGANAKDIMSLVVIAIVSLGKDLIQLDKDKAE